MKPARTLLAAMAAVGLLLSGARASSIAEPGPSVANVAVAVTTSLRVTTLDLLVEAADAGDAEAMNSLGVLYFMGTQVPRDYATALLWLQKAIDGGSSDAMSNLATMYLLGTGVPRDPVNAFQWFGRCSARQCAKHVHRCGNGGRGAWDAAGRDTRAHPVSRSGGVRIRGRDGPPERDYAASGNTQDLVEAYAWAGPRRAIQLPDDRHRRPGANGKAGARLAPEPRDQARALAVRRLADMRTRAVSAQRAPAELEFGMRTAPGGASTL